MSLKKTEHSKQVTSYFSFFPPLVYGKALIKIFINEIFALKEQMDVRIEQKKGLYLEAKDTLFSSSAGHALSFVEYLKAFKDYLFYYS
jgi:hypothetical protein